MPPYNGNGGADISDPLIDDLDVLLMEFDELRLNRIVTHLNQHYIEPGKLAGCDILLGRYNTPIFRACLGYADRERKKKIEEDTIYRIYSMTKPIVSVALMQLYEGGYFQLNDRISRVIPEWADLEVWVDGDEAPYKTEPVNRAPTFRDVLTHSAGLTYGGGSHPIEMACQRLRQECDENLGEFVRGLGRIPLRYQPGSAWLYSFSTDVCGYLVEVLSGQSLAEYLEENIFEPLLMHDTGFYVPESKKHRFAANYSRGRNKELVLIDDPEESAYLRKPGFLSGGGGLVSTTSDYANFCDMILSGGVAFEANSSILSPMTINLMGRNHLPGEQDLSDLAIGAFSETPYEGIGFGLGFATTLDEVRAGQFGAGDMFWGGAASTIFWIDPRLDIFVIFMTQFMPSNTFNFRGQLKNLVYSSLLE